jgi:hypothetical protein
MWLVIDTNVLVDASGQGVPAHAKESLDLLGRLQAIPEFALAIDFKKKLLREYENRVNGNMYAHHWLIRLNREQRIQTVPRVRIPKGAKVELLEAHLHQEDWPLVEAALGSHNIIITRDFRSFQDDICSILRRKLGISVLSAAEMLARLANALRG